MSPWGPLCSGECSWGGPVACQLLGCHSYQGMPRAEQHQVLSPHPPRCGGRGSGYRGTRQVGSWQRPMGMRSGSQGTVTKEPSPWNLHLTPLAELQAARARAPRTQHTGSLEASDWAAISSPLPAPHLTQASVHQIPDCPPLGSSLKWCLAIVVMVTRLKCWAGTPLLSCPLCIPPIPESRLHPKLAAWALPVLPATPPSPQGSVHI